MSASRVASSSTEIVTGVPPKPSARKGADFACSRAHGCVHDLRGAKESAQRHDDADRVGWRA